MSDRDVSHAELLRLLDIAIGKATDLEKALKDAGEPEWMLEAAELTRANLITLRSTVAAGNLPRPSRGDVPPGTGLGLAQNIGEWTDDSDLLRSVRDAEEFYRTRY